MSLRRHHPSLAMLLIIGVGAQLAASALVFARDRSHMDHAYAHGGEGLIPTMPRQEVFGTIQEIVRMLEADPATDWSKVNIGALREHLIDMDEVTMRARASERVLNNGLEIAVTGRPAHSPQSNGWSPAYARADCSWLEHEEPGLAQRREACGDRKRSAPSHQDQGARVHGHHGARGAPPDASFDDGER